MLHLPYTRKVSLVFVWTTFSHTYCTYGTVFPQASHALSAVAFKKKPVSPVCEQSLQEMPFLILGFELGFSCDSLSVV